MTFDQEATSQATEFPDAATYAPSKFLTDALQQSKVHLTWDETDQDRVAFTMKNFSKEDMEDMDVKAYLASDSDDDGGGLDPYAGIEEPDFGDAGGSSKQAKNDDDDDDDNEETQIDKYRALLKGLKDAEEEKEEDDKDMEITWEPGLKGATEDLVTSKEQAEDDPQTPWDSYLDERKHKKKEKKKGKVAAAKSKAEEDEAGTQAFSDDELPDDIKGSVFQDSLASKKKKFSKKKIKPVPATEEEAKQAEELSLLLMDENEEEKGAKHFSLSAIQEAEQLQTKKRKRKKLIARGETVPQVDDFKVDVADSRFNELFDNPLYNIDPSAPEYKKTNAMDALVQEKVKRRRKNNYKPQNSKNTSAAADADKKNSSLSSLVNSVKAKTKSIQEKKKKKALK
ncbi:hypothetical protein CAPTEDRAFT_163742 [Capitella teleta]|uniref:NUC153 domain-containing protein n=1 Tax=Capitella teleta TaxID=283909 RepID=R7TRI6_CAPTE|nr:hypothetical protein CAPTEDRAFT_163742 [Capitella teleta]|eukprot:ELT94111.1 hypothetical protein CAPTEDRAFT_163742 [Capitella teleta]